MELEQEGSNVETNEIPDERLKLIFTCCHPALSKEAQVALTLHTLGGLTTPEIAHVTFTLHFEPKGLAKLMEPMIASTMRSEVATLSNLKAYLENRS